MTRKHAGLLLAVSFALLSLTSEASARHGYCGSRFAYRPYVASGYYYAPTYAYPRSYSCSPGVSAYGYGPYYSSYPTYYSSYPTYYSSYPTYSSSYRTYDPYDHHRRSHRRARNTLLGIGVANEVFNRGYSRRAVRGGVLGGLLLNQLLY